MAVKLFLEAGPQSGGNIIEKIGSCALNPFACSGYEGQLTITAAFDSQGQFSIGTSFDQSGGPLPIVNGNLPFVEVPGSGKLLAVSGTAISIREIFNERLLR